MSDVMNHQARDREGLQICQSGGAGEMAKFGIVGDEAQGDDAVEAGAGIGGGVWGCVTPTPRYSDTPIFFMLARDSACNSRSLIKCEMRSAGVSTCPYS